ncbi:TetR/AcrR family transcriptional regulator C-terminal domain-containing protein [Klebsiella variicola subsp. variicola]|nr:TetR/AcrR family transcriptional regulator C-terminal domain-containing protein [Klebsiella variicola subsp. variicola]
MTTRKLAKAGGRIRKLYWHFRNKASLPGRWPQLFSARHHSLPLAEDTAEWADWLANNARSFRRALLAHRDGALLHAGDNTGAGRRGNVLPRGGLPYAGRLF